MDCCESSQLYSTTSSNLFSHLFHQEHKTTSTGFNASRPPHPIRIITLPMMHVARPLVTRIDFSPEVSTLGHLMV